MSLAPPSPRIPAAVLGATGSVGQKFVQLLAEHPWFEVVAVAASARSAGRSYVEAARWFLPAPIPAAVAGLAVQGVEEELPCRLVFSALDAAVAGEAEARFAERGAIVVSNARNHRMHPHVPLLVPEINPDHLALLDAQEWRGRIVTNPNCSTIGLVLALQPLVRAFGVEAVQVVTMQALSGAGHPGVPGLDIVDNVVPHIGGEEEKMESEPRKILGVLEGGAVRSAELAISASCNRVAVLDGHLQSVSVKLERPATAGAILEAWSSFRGVPQELGLPSAPAQPVIHLAGEAEPQPKLHRDLGGGMSVSVGRLRPCPVLGWKFTTLSHNTVRGAAGAAILNAELLYARGLLA